MSGVSIVLRSSTVSSLSGFGEQPARLPQPRTVERVAHAAGVGELRLPDAVRDVVLENVACAGAEAVVLLLEHHLGDPQQFALGEVRELEVMRDARAHARIRLEERLHAIAVARQDHDEVVAVVLHHLQQDLDRFLAVVALVVGAIEVVRLVDEQHATHRFLQHFARLGRGVADVLADEVVARHRNQVAFADVAESVKDLRHAQRDGRLARAGVAREGHVQARRLCLQALVHA